ncbi:hypothetical protein [Sulfitobacter sp. JB4-11]|uniref:hypothetical protein n=1 Tax=Sulfitobacter rhodophyticola TaxID=3238304 RepID=UPI003511F105
MQLVLHTGAHYTEQERLIQSLLGNSAAFDKQGITVPDPDSYRGMIRDTLNAMHRAPASEEAREVLLDVILGDSDAQRVILSDPNFFRTQGTAMQKGVLYPAAPTRMAHMAQLFPDDDLQIFLAVRNPATFLPILHGVAVDNDPTAFWGGRQPMDIRWSETLVAIREAVPHVPITVWCNEDMPLIWSQIIREMAGLDDGIKISGGFDLLMSIMSKEGMQRFRAYLASHPDMSEVQKRRVIAAFLDKFALDEEIEEELDMPGWTEDLVDAMTVQYDQDIEDVAKLPNLTVIAP